MHNNSGSLCKHSDLQSKDQRVTLEEAIHSFIDSDSAVLSFPSSLTGNERKIVHEVRTPLNGTYFHTSYDYTTAL